MSFNSDYDVRLATLAALGGDTAKTYDSVYDIDLAILDAIEQGGGGGGMTYDQIKTLLASSGVTEIVVNGDGDSITLDYDLLAQIGQGGGGDYMVVEGIDALSGITSPKDGMLAYVGAHTEQEERMVVSVDCYSEWFMMYADYGSDVVEEIWFNEAGKRIYIQNGRWYSTNDGWFHDIPDHRSELPQDFYWNNHPITGTLISNVNGAEYAEHNEYLNTIYLPKYNGVFPTITFSGGEGQVVSTAATVETVSVTYKAKGFWKYYADQQRWLAYDIIIDNLSKEELQNVCNNYHSYLKPLSINWLSNDGRPTQRKGFVGSYSNDEGYTTLNFTTNPDRDDSNTYRIYARNYYLENNSWRYNSNSEFQIPSQSDINRYLKESILNTSADYPDLIYGGLRSVGITGTFSGVTISTSITVNSGDTDYQGMVDWQNRRSGKWFNNMVNENGYVKVCGMSLSASTSAEWFVFDYNVDWMDDQQRHNAEVAAIKVEDNGNDTFTITYFMTNDNWKDGDGDPDDHHWWTDEHRGETNDYSFRYNGDRGYTWTVTEHQTITVAPHLYQGVYDPTLPMDNYRVKLVHKLL